MCLRSLPNLDALDEQPQQLGQQLVDGSVWQLFAELSQPLSLQGGRDGSAS